MTQPVLLSLSHLTIATHRKSMSVLLENATNYIWQAFSALQQDKSGLVSKTKLKVLTANIGTLLDLYGIERGLEHYRSTQTLSFDQYKYYLQQEVFCSSPNKLTLPELRQYEHRIAEVCWLVSRRKLLEDDMLTSVFTEDCIFMIFRIFCTLAELKQEEGNLEVVLSPEEAAFFAEKLAKNLGSAWDEEDFERLSVCMGAFRFSSFVAVLESKCLEKVEDTAAIIEAVSSIYQTVVEDVIKKGFLSKKGYIFPAMREYWFVLRPSELTFFKTRSETQKCGTITLEPSNRVEPKTDFKITLHTSERVFDLAAQDHMSRLQWISALQVAIKHSGGHQTFQRLQASKRRRQRKDRLLEMEAARSLLQMERQARKMAESQARELEAAAKEESKRLSELEQARVRLERLLEEETLAKRDEEIVRGLQARVLAEEWEKREEMERLQKEQRALLEMERQKRKEFQELQMEKEMQLKDAQIRLEQLETERKNLDKELKLALDKMKLSEEKKEILEAKLYRMVPIKDGEPLRRAHSFMPSTKERPIVLEVKASTLKKIKK